MFSMTDFVVGGEYSIEYTNKTGTKGMQTRRIRVLEVNRDWIDADDITLDIEEQRHRRFLYNRMRSVNELELKY